MTIYICISIHQNRKKDEAILSRTQKYIQTNTPKHRSIHRHINLETQTHRYTHTHRNTQKQTNTYININKDTHIRTIKHLPMPITVEHTNSEKST